MKIKIKQNITNISETIENNSFLVQGTIESLEAKIHTITISIEKMIDMLYIKKIINDFDIKLLIHSITLEDINNISIIK